MALRDLFIRFGISVDGQGKLDNLEQKIQKTKKSSLDLGGALKALTAIWIGGRVVRGIKDFVEGNIQAADALKHQAETLGLTTDELQKYQYVSGLMQVPVQQTAVALRFFNRAIGEVRLGTKGTTKTIAQLGDAFLRDAKDPTKSTSDLLFEFADRLKKVPDQATRTALAMRTLGRGGAALLPVLQNGSEELRQMFRDIEELGGGFDDEFIQKAHEVDVQQKRLAMGWRSMGVAILKELLPYMKQWLDVSIKHVKALIELNKHTTLVASAIRFLGVIAVATAVAVSAAWFPEIAIFAAITEAVYLLYLTFDDFYAFLNGKKSIIGDSIDAAGGNSKNVAHQIMDALKGVSDAFSKASGASKDLFDAFVSSIPTITKWSTVVATSIVGVLDTAVTGFRQLFTLIAGIGSPIQALKDAAKLGEDWQARAAKLQNLNGFVDQLTNPRADPQAHAGDAADAAFMKTHPDWKKINGQWVQHPDVMDLPPPPPPQQNNQVHVVVHTQATDAQGTGRAVADGVTEAMKRNTFNAVSDVAPEH